MNVCKNSFLENLGANLGRKWSDVTTKSSSESCREG